MSAKKFSIRKKEFRGREREREEVCSWTDWEAGKLRGQEEGRSPGKEIRGHLTKLYMI